MYGFVWAQSGEALKAGVIGGVKGRDDMEARDSVLGLSMEGEGWGGF